MIALKFIRSSQTSPLHAPKGLAIVGKTLYVLDLDHVRGYDTERGGVVLDIDMTPYKARFLNDLTRDANGILYLSDSQSNFIARIEPPSARAPASRSSPAAPRSMPNGLSNQSRRRAGWPSSRGRRGGCWK